MPKVTVAILLCLLLGCGKLNEITAPDDDSGGGPPPDPAATFTRVQSEIFTPSCAVLGCHDTIGRQSDLILSTGRSYSEIVNRPSVQMPSLRRVQPNDPNNSYLYRKLTGVGIVDERMPQFGPPLPADKLALVRDWIRRGAPND
ncbi:MAG TPA: hypothetical protein VMS98_12920 [Thermoanaerobaculia bacterium]|nr:hypothetical protein [Thermoanaerobaculia bacterium]